MSEGSTSRGSGVKAIIADLQQKIAESDGEWLSDRELTQMRARAGGRLLAVRKIAGCFR